MAVSAVQSVIKDLGCGSCKYTQTRGHSSTCVLIWCCTSVHVHVVDVSAHMCIHSSTSVFMHVFLQEGQREGGQVTAKQLATTSHPLPTHAPWMLQRHISAETAGIVTAWIQHLQHTATWREVRRGEGMSQVE